MLPRATVPELSRRSGLNSLFSQRAEPVSLVSVVAHPGDEVIAAGACFEEWKNTIFVHMTDGAPRHLDLALDAGYECRDEYARARRHEFEAALQCAGVHEPRVENLGYEDGEVCWALASATMSIASLLHETSAEMVVTHPYEGENPDRDATAFAVQSACQLLARDGLTPPARIEFAGAYVRNGTLKIGKFPIAATTEAVTIRLDADHQNLKRAMFERLETQRPLLENVEIHAESFRQAPVYDFTTAPRGGALEYDRQGFGINGRRWSRLTAEALRVLGLAD